MPCMPTDPLIHTSGTSKSGNDQWTLGNVLYNHTLVMELIQSVVVFLHACHHHHRATVIIITLVEGAGQAANAASAQHARSISCRKSRVNFIAVCTYTLSLTSSFQTRSTNIHADIEKYTHAVFAESIIMASKAVAILSLLVAACCCALPAAQAQLQNNENLPVSFPVAVLEAGEDVCPSEDQREEARSSIVDQVRAVILNLDCLGSTQDYPVNSCSEINQQSCPSDYYWIQNGTGGATRVYCDMNRHCCNSTGGSMRVAYLNVTEQLECPAGFTLITDPVTACGRVVGGGCTSIVYSTYGIGYSRVCGRIEAYQHGSPDSFVGGSIDSQYLDGISITYGSSPRKHIWTFAAARTEMDNACPCLRTDITSSTGTVPPSFVGSDYFCDTGTGNSGPIPNVYFPDNPLWDGQGCGPTSSCCSFNNPPWFCKELPQPTNDNIEVRVCGNEGIIGDPNVYNEDTPVNLIELYAQ